MIPRRHPSALRLGAWSGLVLGAVLAGACFDAPRPAVQFSCDPTEAPACPPDYTCEADGCCHLEGSDVAAHEGECQLGGAMPTGGSGPGTDTGASTTGEASTSSDSTATSGSSDATTGTGGSASESGGSDSTASSGDSSGGSSGTAT